MILRIIAEEIALSSSANTVSDARAVRIYNDSGVDVLITRTDTVSNTVVGSVTLANNEIALFDKNQTDTLAASANVKATAIAFSVS